jgi:TrmH family RNA methyltransferase
MPALVLYTEAWAASNAAQQLLPALSGATEGAWLVTDSVLASCADTRTPQGVLAVLPLIKLRPRPGLILILDQVRDPGNLGTVLRSAEAAGTGQVLLAPGTVDVYSPKVVRAAMGAHFRLPVVDLDWASISRRLAGREVWLADSGGDVAYSDVDWTRPAAVIIGGEAEGASEHAANLATGRICIPMAGGAESLNAAMAATVILFEAARQRQR